MKKVTVFFRYDDFSETSSDTVDRGLIAVLRRCRVPCTFAVIPSVTAGSYRDPADTGTMPLGSVKLSLLAEAVAEGVVDVFLHGLNHRTRYKDGPHSEFVGLDRKTQTAMIREGKQRLESSLGISIRGFVPPWNNYDTATLAALRDCGIYFLSANRYSPFQKDPGIRYLPITIETHDLRLAVAQARRCRDDDPIIGVLLHPYDFKESGDNRAKLTCPEFEDELKWLGEQEDVQVLSVSKILEQNSSFGEDRFLANRPAMIENIFPPFVRRTVDTPLYLTAASAKATRRVKSAITVGFYLGTTAVAYLLGARVLSLMPIESGLPVIQWCVWGALGVLSVKFGITKKVYFRAMTVWAGLAGLGLALAVA